MGSTMWFFQSQKKGEDRIAEKRKRDMVQKGREKKLEGEAGGEQKKHLDKIPLAVQHCPKGSSPQGMSEAITKSSCIPPLGSSET